MAKIGKAGDAGFDVIYVDPPWSYKSKRAGAGMNSGAAQKYPTLTVEEICALPIREIANRNSVVFMWVPAPLKIPAGYQVFEAWDLTYKTTLYWHKTNLGMGYWFRGQMEECWVGIYGKASAFRCQERNVIQHKPLKHSQKPDAFRELIERAARRMPGPRIELFATSETAGWTCLGLEIDGRDIRNALNGIRRVMNGQRNHSNI